MQKRSYLRLLLVLKFLVILLYVLKATSVSTKIRWQSNTIDKAGLTKNANGQISLRRFFRSGIKKAFFSTFGKLFILQVLTYFNIRIKFVIKYKKFSQLL